MGEVKEESRATDEVGCIGDVRRRLDGNLGLGLPGPAFVNHHSLLQFAHAREVFVELLAVGLAGGGAQGLRLAADVVEDAAAIFETAHSVPNLFSPPFEEQLSKDSGRGII